MRQLLRRTQRSDAGFGLVEVVVACVILGVLAAAVLGIILKSQAQGVTNRSRIAASNLAAREIDIVRDEFHRTSTGPTDLANAGTVVNPHQLDGGVQGQPLQVDGKLYTVTRSVQWNITGNGQSACSGGNLVVYPTLGVTVSVTWPAMGAVKPVVSTAQLAPDKGDGIPSTDSFIAVRVNDENGDPSVGRGIDVTGGGATKHGTTDASGCAVVEVSPAAGAGTTYTAKVTDDGYVDIGSTQYPTKNVGQVSRGQLKNQVSFQVALGGTVSLHVTDAGGTDLASLSSPQTVTLVASEFAGASPYNSQTMTSPVTTVGPLWPTTYGAFYGSPPEPATGPAESAALAPGGHLDLRVPIEYAHTAVVDAPAGTTDVYAVPSGATGACTSSQAVHLGNLGSVELLPGSWMFYAKGARFACAPGPGAPVSASDTVAPIALAPGENSSVQWQASWLTVTGAPTGQVYALDAGIAGSLAACPDPSMDTSTAYALSGATALPAGNWNLYVRNGSTCTLAPSSISPLALPNGASLTKAWPPHTASVTISSIDYISSSGNSPKRYYWPTVYLSSLPVSGLSCTQYGISPSSAVTQVLAGGDRTTDSTARSTTVTVGNSTWYVIGNDQNSNYGQTRYSGTCQLAGTLNISGSVNSVTINYTASSQGTPQVKP